MKEWDVRPGEPISLEELKKRARALFKELVFWNLVQTTDPAKQKARDELIELRFQVEQQLDVLIPGWAE